MATNNRMKYPKYLAKDTPDGAMYYKITGQYNFVSVECSIVILVYKNELKCDLWFDTIVHKLDLEKCNKIEESNFNKVLDKITHNLKSQ